MGIKSLLSSVFPYSEEHLYVRNGKNIFNYILKDVKVLRELEEDLRKQKVDGKARTRNIEYANAISRLNQNLWIIEKFRTLSLYHQNEQLPLKTRPPGLKENKPLEPPGGQPENSVKKTATLVKPKVRIEKLSSLAKKPKEVETIEPKAIPNFYIPPKKTIDLLESNLAKLRHARRTLLPELVKKESTPTIESQLKASRPPLMKSNPIRKRIIMEETMKWPDSLPSKSKSSKNDVVRTLKELAARGIPTLTTETKPSLAIPTFETPRSYPIRSDYYNNYIRYRPLDPNDRKNLDSNLKNKPTNKVQSTSNNPRSTKINYSNKYDTHNFSRMKFVQTKKSKTTKTFITSNNNMVKKKFKVFKPRINSNMKQAKKNIVNLLKMEQSPETGKTEKQQKPEKPEKAEKPERSAKAQKVGKPEISEKAEISEKPERNEKNPSSKKATTTNASAATTTTNTLTSKTVKNNKTNLNPSVTKTSTTTNNNNNNNNTNILNITHKKSSNQAKAKVSSNNPPAKPVETKDLNGEAACNILKQNLKLTKNNNNNQNNNNNNNKLNKLNAYKKVNSNKSSSNNGRKLMSEPKVHDLQAQPGPPTTSIPMKMMMNLKKKIYFYDDKTHRNFSSFIKKISSGNISKSLFDTYKIKYKGNDNDDDDDDINKDKCLTIGHNRTYTTAAAAAAAAGSHAKVFSSSDTSKPPPVKPQDEKLLKNRISLTTYHVKRIKPKVSVNRSRTAKVTELQELMQLDEGERAKIEMETIKHLSEMVKPEFLLQPIVSDETTY